MIDFDNADSTKDLNIKNCSESLHFDAQKRDIATTKHFIRSNFDQLLLEHCALYKALHLDKDKTCAGEIAMKFAKLKLIEELVLVKKSEESKSNTSAALFDDKGHKLSS